MNNYKALVSFYGSKIHLPLDNVWADSESKAKSEVEFMIEEEGYDLQNVKSIKITRVK